MPYSSYVVIVYQRNEGVAGAAFLGTNSRGRECYAVVSMSPAECSKGNQLRRVNGLGKMRPGSARARLICRYEGLDAAVCSITLLTPKRLCSKCHERVPRMDVVYEQMQVISFQTC
jgi:hypothetical protein